MSMVFPWFKIAKHRIICQLNHPLHTRMQELKSLNYSHFSAYFVVKSESAIWNHHYFSIYYYTAKIVRLPKTRK